MRYHVHLTVYTEGRIGKCAGAVATISVEALDDAEAQRIAQDMLRDPSDVAEIEETSPREFEHTFTCPCGAEAETNYRGEKMCWSCAEGLSYIEREKQR